MIIRKIHIENFGHFHDFTLELVPGLNRLRRANEFGKTTLFEFVSRVLWGFPDGRKTTMNRYPAYGGSGRYGGFLEVELADGSTAVLERYDERGKLVVRRPDGGEISGEEFLSGLTFVSGECYRNVYAVTVDELTDLATLDGDEIRGRLYGGAIVGEGVSLPELGKRLDEQAKALFKGRRGISRIGDARKEYRRLCEERDRTVNASARRAELEAGREELRKQAGEAREQALAAAKQLSETDLMLKAHPKLAELDAARRELAELPLGADVPEASAQTAEELARRIAAAERELAPAPDPGRVDALAGEVVLLDRESAYAGAPPAPVPAAAEIARAEELERAQEELGTAPRFPAAVWVAALDVLFAAAAGVGIEAFRLPAIGLALLGVAVGAGAYLNYRRRAGAWMRRLQMLAEARREFRRRCGMPEDAPSLAAPLRARLRRRQAAAELEKLRADAEAHRRVGTMRGQLDALCRRFGAADAGELRRLADLTSKREALKRRAAEARAALDALLDREGQSRLAVFDPQAARALRAGAEARRAEAEKSLSLLDRQAGALDNELERLPREGEIEVRAAEAEQAKDRLRSLVREYLTVRACRALLDAAVDRYERESQPEVLKAAEKIFADLTGGRYDRLYKKLATGDIAVCDSVSGREKGFTELSRGTREELMLAMRLALIECTERASEPLPVCFDDVGVDFDSARLKRAEAAVAAFAAKRQVIWFSHS